MKDHWQNLLTELNFQPGETILDVGGAMDPVPIADMVIDIQNLNRGGKAYTILDLNSDIFPFKDKSFDVCVCSNTLEDLPSPGLALKEMSRVAKRGVIEVPHRGVESLRNMHYDGYPKPSGSYDEIWCFGTEHHKWLIEEIGGELDFTIKNQMFLMSYPIPKWTGPTSICFYWQDYIRFNVHYDIYMNITDKNYAEFKARNRHYWAQK